MKNEITVWPEDIHILQEGAWLTTSFGFWERQRHRRLEKLLLLEKVGPCAWRTTLLGNKVIKILAERRLRKG